MTTPAAHRLPSWAWAALLCLLALASPAQAQRVALVVGNAAYADKPLRNPVKIIDNTTGMIGIPEATERGVSVRILFDLQTDLGGQIDLTSELNPALDGSYTIYKIDFDLASREAPWYLDIEASRNG